MFYSNEDHIWMHQALNQACNSSTFDEVPVGAVITDGTKLIAAAGNNPISANDPTAHAEINAIRIAAHNLDNYRLKGTTIYVTLEPCIMCMGAIIHSRIERLVFGAFDPKTGAAVSKYQIGSDRLLNHTLIVEGGLLEKECGTLLKTFFRNRRGNAIP